MHALHQTPHHLKRRTDLHLARKIWHSAGVLSIAAVYSQLTDHQAVIAICLLWFLFVPFDFLRQRSPSLNEWILEKFGWLFRQHEADHLAGTSYLMTGVAILVTIFRRDISMLTILFLALADPLASLVGIRFGKIKILGAKSLEGTLASFAICTLIAALYFSKFHLFSGHEVRAACLAGVIGAVSELVPLFGLDDNLTFPLLCALLLTFMEKTLV